MGCLSWLELRTVFVGPYSGSSKAGRGMLAGLPQGSWLVCWSPGWSRAHGTGHVIGCMHASTLKNRLKAVYASANVQHAVQQPPPPRFTALWSVARQHVKVVARDILDIENVAQLRERASSLRSLARSRSWATFETSKYRVLQPTCSPALGWPDFYSAIDACN